MKTLVINTDLIENQYQNNKDIEEVIIKGNVTIIPEGCFARCDNLKKVTFENGVIDIEACAFFDCNNLNKIVVPDTIKTIKDFAFHGCNNNIIVNSDNKLKNIKFGANNDIISNYFILPETGVTFDELSWHKINMISEQGLAEDCFNIRDIKIIKVGDEIYHVQILGFNHDNKSDGSGKAGITAQLKEIMTTTYFMNSYGENTGGWKDSEMRTYVNNDVYSFLPSDLQAVIKSVDKVSDNGNKNTTTLNTTQDKLFLLSLEEVGFTSSDSPYFVPGQGTKYEYFTDDASRVKSYLNGESMYWWLRSAYTNSGYIFCGVYDDGGYDYNNAYSVFGVAPAFCI